ncbi:MbeB family mobilization protein [Serratia marcescens]
MSSEILNLAKGFEEKSKQQAQDTEQSVKREFGRLETSISAELQSSSQSISNAIREQNGRLTGMIRSHGDRRADLDSGLRRAPDWYPERDNLASGADRYSSRLSDIDGYSQQLASLKAKSGAGGDDAPATTARRTAIWWCCR